MEYYRRAKQRADAVKRQKAAEKLLAQDAEQQGHPDNNGLGSGAINKPQQ